jgi:hypothetical protein
MFPLFSGNLKINSQTVGIEEDGSSLNSALRDELRNLQRPFEKQKTLPRLQRE